MIVRLFIISLFLSPMAVSGQARYNFFTIGLDQGLSSANIWAINQDKQGFIWIGTVNGLNRYDGHSIKSYFHDPQNRYSIAGNVCYWIYRDSEGDMWFACGADGLSKYNYASDNFESLPAYDSARKHNQFQSPVWRFGEDKRKRLYLSCGGACYRYDLRTKKFEDLTPFFGKGWNTGIGRFYMQNDSIMWLATDAGLFRLNVDTDEMRPIPFDGEKLGHGSIRMYDIELMNGHELLISMNRAGYVIFDTRTETFRPADDFFNPAKTGKYTEMGEALHDSRGRYWMANTVQGLLEYFPKTGKSVLMKKEPLYPYPYTEQEGQGKALFEDKDGNIWYGTTTKGIIRFQPDFDFIRLYSRDYSLPQSLPDDAVYTFYPVNNDMWIGTLRGYTRFNVSTNQYTNFPEGIGSHQVRTMDRSGDTLYIMSVSGLIAYHLRNNTSRTWSQETDSSSIFDNNMRHVIVVRPGELIIANQQIARFYPASGRSTHKKNTPGDPLYDFTNVGVLSLDRSRHTLWIEENGELYSYELAAKKIMRHRYRAASDTTKQAVYVITTDENGKVWMATTAGIIHYDQVTRQSRVVWPSATATVVNLQLAGDWIWFTTRNEVGRINRRTNKTEIFVINALLPKASIITRSMRMDPSGKYWIGTNQGYFVMDTSQFVSNAISYFPRLVGFKVFDQEKQLGKPAGEVEHIDLRYGENFFSFSFSAFNFQNIQGTRYAYKLDGFDKDWHYTSGNTASYTNVPSGKYTLLIRSANSFGGWDDMRQPITIHVQPPFWKKAWFISLLVAVMIGAAAWLYFRRKHALQKKNIDKTIDYFANSVYGENSVNEICWDIARNCISQLQFEDCVVYLLDEKTGRLVQKAAYGPKNPKGHEIIDPIEIDIGKGIVGAVAATGRPELIHDTSKDSRYIVDDERRFSELAVPILHDGKVIGVIDSEHPRRHFFSEEHLKVMTTIASISANKIAEAQAEEYAKQNEIKLLEIRKMLAESQLMALRAQMNPHFVFNCLNSIQECIVTQKYGEASKYLNKFSKLFRMVLNNSGKNLVTLSEEKEVLELYLELEQMRFEKSFSWDMILDEDLEADEVLIPSMLLQPYVENALWHGLMHKEGDRVLRITFRKLSEDVFRCTIDDNGIGRKRSYELKAQQSKAKRHESKGLKISKDRIEVLQKQGYHATLDIADKYNEAGEATGTTITIELSTFLKN